MKRYKGIFFDWDGTAVISRKAPVDEVASAMKNLLAKGIKLIIISGTTYENIAGGRLESYFTNEELNHLFLGLGRGAYNYRFIEGQPTIWKHSIPVRTELSKIHEICFRLHKKLFETYEYPTDIVFSRPNYCKIDLMVENNREERMFLQESELELLKSTLKKHGFEGGISRLIEMAEEIGKEYGIPLSCTSDAKYLEIGASSKSNNVNVFMDYFQNDFGITQQDCAFWGDEYVGLDVALYGSDSFMITDMSKNGDFFDVSETSGKRPKEVKVLNGGVNRFLDFLKDQSSLGE